MEEGYTCTDGDVIPYTWICDNFEDCSSGEDEDYCTSRFHNTSEIVYISIDLLTLTTFLNLINVEILKHMEEVQKILQWKNRSPI